MSLQTHGSPQDGSKTSSLNWNDPFLAGCERSHRAWMEGTSGPHCRTGVVCQKQQQGLGDLSFYSSSVRSDRLEPGVFFRCGLATGSVDPTDHQPKPSQAPVLGR